VGVVCGAGGGYFFVFFVHNKVQRDGSTVNVRTLWRNDSLVGGECIRRGDVYGGEKRKRKERKEGRASKEKYVRKERGGGEGREREFRIVGMSCLMASKML
jgi:hypothetical protein